MSTDSKYYQYNPEKRNVFIETHGGRNNVIIALVYMFLGSIASFGASIVEVFLRRKFGERYLTLSLSIIIFLAMNFAYDYLAMIAVAMGARISRDGETFLFIFSLIYLGLSIMHRLEIRKYGTTYDFNRFSLSDGERAPFWRKIIGKKFLKIKVTSYLVSVLLEPLIPVIVGLLMLPFEFSSIVGAILIFSGICYALKNFGMAQSGRNWVLDNIDKRITNEVQYDVFIGRKPKSETKGVYLPIELPEDEATRLALYKSVEDSTGYTHNIWESDDLESKADGSREGGNG
jgi:hypothetical protein